MRPLSLTGKPGPNASLPEQVRWLMDAVTKVATFSRQEGSVLADPYVITAPATLLRTLDPATATTADVAAVLATFLLDTQQRGANQKKLST